MMSERLKSVGHIGFLTASTALCAACFYLSGAWMMAGIKYHDPGLPFAMATFWFLFASAYAAVTVARALHWWKS